MKKIIGTVALAAASLGLAACTAEESLNAPEAPAADSETTEPTQPQAPETEASDSDSAPSARADVPIENFNGAYAEMYPFDVYVNEAYVDEDGYITDGYALSDQAPVGMEYQIFNVQVTNSSTFPGPFSTEGTLARDTEGRIHANDVDAEWTVADTYLGEDLYPGDSVEADFIFLVPEGTSLEVIDVVGYDTLEPFDE